MGSTKAQAVRTASSKEGFGCNLGASALESLEEEGKHRSMG